MLFFFLHKVRKSLARVTHCGGFTDPNLSISFKNKNSFLVVTLHTCVFVSLQVLGFEVDSINSVQFSNHTGKTNAFTVFLCRVCCSTRRLVSPLVRFQSLDARKKKKES